MLLNRTFVYDEDVALFAYIKNLLLPQQGSKEDPAYKEKVLEAIPLVTSSDNLYKMLRSVFNVVREEYSSLSNPSLCNITLFEYLSRHNHNVSHRVIDLCESFRLWLTSMTKILGIYSIDT